MKKYPNSMFDKWMPNGILRNCGEHTIIKYVKNPTMISQNVINELENTQISLKFAISHAHAETQILPDITISSIGHKFYRAENKLIIKWNFANILRNAPDIENVIDFVHYINNERITLIAMCNVHINDKQILSMLGGDFARFMDLAHAETHGQFTRIGFNFRYFHLSNADYHTLISKFSADFIIANYQKFDYEELAKLPVIFEIFRKTNHPLPLWKNLALNSAIEFSDYLLFIKNRIPIWEWNNKFTICFDSGDALHHIVVRGEMFSPVAVEYKGVRVDIDFDTYFDIDFSTATNLTIGDKSPEERYRLVSRKHKENIDPFHFEFPYRAMYDKNIHHSQLPSFIMDLTENLEEYRANLDYILLSPNVTYEQIDEIFSRSTRARGIMSL